MMKSLKFKSVYLVVLLSLLLSLLPVAGGGVALAAAGDLVPLGDQLGDVGQYYSQVGPSMKSRIHIRNMSMSSKSVNVIFYNDTGTTLTSLSCAVPAAGLLVVKLTDTANGCISVLGR